MSGPESGANPSRLMPTLSVFFYKPFLLDIKEREKAEMEKAAAIVELQKAIDEIKILKGLIPICAKELYPGLL